MGKQQPKSRTRKHLWNKRSRAQRERRERELQKKWEQQALEDMLSTDAHSPDQSEVMPIQIKDVVSLRPQSEESPQPMFGPFEPSPLTSPIKHIDSNDQTAVPEFSKSPLALRNFGVKTPEKSPVKLAAVADVPSSPSSDYIVMVEKSRKATHFPPGNVICDLGHVVEQARAVERHSSECRHGGVLVLTSTKQHGLSLIATYKCSKILCPITMTLTTHPDVKHLHVQSVLGVMSTGSGFAKEQERFAAQNITYMSSKTFSKYKKIVELFLKKEAAKEKKKPENNVISTCTKTATKEKKKPEPTAISTYIKAIDSH